MLSIKLLPTFSYLNSCFRAFRQVFPKIIGIRTTKHAKKKVGGGGGVLWPTCPPLRSYRRATYRGERGTMKEWKGVIEKIKGLNYYFAGKNGEDKKKAQLSELLVQIKS